MWNLPIQQNQWPYSLSAHNKRMEEMYPMKSSGMAPNIEGEPIRKAVSVDSSGFESDDPRLRRRRTKSDAEKNPVEYEWDKLKEIAHDYKSAVSHGYEKLVRKLSHDDVSHSPHEKPSPMRHSESPH